MNLGHDILMIVIGLIPGLIIGFFVAYISVFKGRCSFCKNDYAKLFKKESTYK